MELLSVRLARVLAVVPIDELNPRGRALEPELTQGLVERYKFWKYPQAADDFDIQKGIRYEGGQWNGVSVDLLMYASFGIVIDTRSSTADSERILEDALAWESERFNQPNPLSKIMRKTYVSELYFTTDVSLNALHPMLNPLSERLTLAGEQQLKRRNQYEVVSISLHVDTTTTTNPPSALRIERMNEIPFEENKYYSVAPLSTEEHLQVLTDFEATLKS